jgi:hypothetical protein
MALDGEGIVRSWINDSSGLTGEGKPIRHGAHLKRLRSPGSGAYIRLLSIGAGPDLTAETPVSRVRLSATVYAGTKEASASAAVAYATVLEGMNGAPVRMGDYRCLLVDAISGPLPIDDQDTTKEQFRYMVDADFYLTV